MSTGLLARTRRRPANSKNTWAGMVLFVIADAMLFLGLLYAFFYFRTTKVQWPPEDVQFSMLLPGFNIVALLVSSLMIRWAGVAARQNHQDVIKGALAATMLLGLLFITGQVAEYLSLDLSLTDDVFTSVFYLIIGFHAAHVVGGVLILATVTLRAFVGQVGPTRRLALQCAELYWHFVVAAWAVLFAVLYLI